MKIAIASGKGGTGKTFVSTNFFYVASQLGYRVCLVDCDAEEPNVSEFLQGEEISCISATQPVPVFDTSRCTYCKKCGEWCAYNAITVLAGVRFIQVAPELCHGCGACVSACRFGAITETDMPVGTIRLIEYAGNSLIVESKINIGIERPAEIIKQAQKHAETGYEIVFYDSPPGTSCPFIATVENADVVVLVSEPTPFGLNDLKLSIEVLRTLKKPLFVIINKDGMGNADTERFLAEQSIPVLARIPFDTEVARLYATGKVTASHYTPHYLMFEQAIQKLLAL